MFHLRRATRADQPGIAALIRDVYAEYGERLCLEGADSDLNDVEEHYFRRDGWFWVLEQSPHQPKTSPIRPIVGTHALLPIDGDVCTFRRLYLAPALRGGAWGRRLMQVAVDEARRRGFQKVAFWSDTRFLRAHRFFEKFGFCKTGETRTMHDSFEPYDEYRFVLPLSD